MTAIRTALAGLAALALVAPGAPADAASKRHVLFDSYCEFRLGEPIPAGAVKIATLKLGIEERQVLLRYKACRGRSEALIELQGGVVDSITLERPGACVARLACVGEPYDKVARRFRQAARSSSELEGRTVNLAVTTQATIRFNVQATPAKCFKGPKCGPALAPQVVSAINLHR